MDIGIWISEPAPVFSAGPFKKLDFIRPVNHVNQLGTLKSYQYLSNFFNKEDKQGSSRRQDRLLTIHWLI